MTKADGVNLLTTIQLVKRLDQDGVLHLTQQTLNNWVGQEGYPQPTHRSERRGQAHVWRYADVLKWVAEIGTRAQDAMDEPEARRRKLAAEAQLAELALKKAEGKLLDKEEIKQLWFDKCRTIRDGILNIPDRISALVAAESDPARVYTILEIELRKALHEIADTVAPPN